MTDDLAAGFRDYCNCQVGTCTGGDFARCANRHAPAVKERADRIESLEAKNAKFLGALKKISGADLRGARIGSLAYQMAAIASEALGDKS